MTLSQAALQAGCFDKCRFKMLFNSYVEVSAGLTYIANITVSKRELVHNERF